jgi:GNAT superfamily N-acetyltransferase
MTTNIEIESAIIENIPEIQKLNKELFLHEIKSGFDKNLDANWSFSQSGKKEIKQRIISQNSCGFVVKVDNKIIGYLIGLVLQEETGRNESKYAELEHMYIDPKYRNLGIGKKLVKKFKTWAKSKKLKIMKVTVSYKNEKAINFYKKVGLLPVDATLVMKIK